MRRLPISLQSFFIQSGAMALAVCVQLALRAYAAWAPTPWQFVAAHGVTAALLSAAARQPRWWPPLHLVFSPLLLLAYAAGIPAWMYLAAFVLLLLFFWSTFRTRVPLYLSNRRARQAIASLLPRDTPFSFIDIGSGFGGVPLDLEAQRPNGRFYGTEIAPAPWLLSRWRAALRCSGVTLMRRDYSRLDLGEFDFVFAFLSPAVMPDVWCQARAQMKPGSVFLSLSFSVPDCPPDRAIAIAQGPRHTLYAWSMAGAAA